MIPQISEINFPEYATLHEATASFADMGERTITTQVRIDGDVVPDFDGWELEFKGERFVLPIKDPQARKDNTTRNSLVDLTFYSWPIYQMKRFFFFETTTSATGTVMADKYKASVNLNLVDFVSLFNRVLNFYFGGKIVADLASGSYSPQTAFAQIDYSYIWDVLQNFYELYGVRWKIAYDSDDDVYTIKIGYPADVIEDHNFEYGFEGGLLHFERQIEDDNIKNILLGRGGENNIPYRYFKRVDPNNPEWAADPDAIKELENVYFDRLRDSNFRNYVQGWKTNPLRELYPGEDVETYDEDRGERDWAYKKGHEDASFDPVEYVKDEDSIEKYGERWGAIDDNDDIYPTIQGLDILDLGRVDEVVAVSDIITDDIQAYMAAAAEIVSIDGVLSQTDNIPVGSYNQRSIRGGTFTVPSDKKANVIENGWFAIHDSASEPLLAVDTSLSRVRIYDAETDQEIMSGGQGLSAGTYYYVIDITIRNSGSVTLSNVTFGINSLKLNVSDESPEAWKPTFDIWIKNIFDTERESGESDEEYSLRVWKPILGDRLRNEAKVVFSDGPMSISEDYEFTVASYPVPDNTKVTAGGYRSEWKLSLYKSDAEYNVSGLYIPNNTSGGKPIAGNHFFFIGIDMPNMYVTLNEEKLSGYKTLALDSMTEVNPTWVISLDKVRADVVNDDEQRFFDQISIGCELHVKDKRFTANEVLTLFANSITYSWQEPSDGQPYILPDIEIVVSDRIVVEKSSSETMRGDIENIKSTYAKLSDMSTIVPKLTSQSFLKKNGEEDISLSPTRFASLLTSRDFSQGALGGKGWGFYKDNSSQFQEAEAPSRALALMAAPAEDPAEEYVPDSVLELDKLIVRKEMHVNNLVVNQISSVGGKQVLSAASIECVQVVENSNSYDCYFDQKQGTVKNLFAVNDIAMGQVFTPDNAESRYYKMLVTAVYVDHVTLSKTGKVGSGVPQKGDIIVQYGNTSNVSRQYVIIRDVIGGGYERMLSGLNSLSSEGVEYYFAGYDPNITGDSKGRLYIGGTNAYMEFKQAEQKLTVKGDIVADTLVLNGKTQESEGVAYTVPSADIKGLMVMRDSSITEGDNITTFLNGVVGDKVIFGAAMSGAFEKAKAFVADPTIEVEDRPDFLLYRDTTNNRVRIYVKDLVIGDSSNTIAEQLLAITQQFDSLYIGTTKVQKVSGSDSPAAQGLTGITSVNFNDAQEDEVGLEIITVNGQRVLHTSLPFYSDSEVTAGGEGSGGGGSMTTLGSLLNVSSSADDTPSSNKLLVRLAGSTHWTLTDLSDISGTVVGVRMNNTDYAPGTDKVVDLGGVATLDASGKILFSQLPDAILGQLLYGGTVDVSGVATLSTNVKAKLGISSSTVTLTNNTGTYGYGKFEGVYFIMSADSSFASLDLKVGDWLISTGSAWKKIGNTDAVTGVKGDNETNYRIGQVNITKENIGLGNVENTALSTWSGSNNISRLGVITAGEWHGTAIGDAYISSANYWDAKYSLPVSGIPYRDLSIGVQDSLDKADTALQSHQTIYKLTIQKNGVEVGDYTPNSSAKTINITDVASAQTLADLKTLFESMFERVGGGTSSNPYLIHAKYSLYSDGELTAGGVGSGGSGGGCLPLIGGDMLGNINMGTYRVNFGSYNAGIYAIGNDLYLAAGNSSGRVVSTTTFHDSDARLKDIIKNLDFSIDDLRGIPKVLFAWKDDETKQEQIGTIAQGLKDKFPQLVTVGKDSYYAVNYDALGVLALHGIDLLAEENRILKERLRKIEEKTRTVWQ